MAGREGERRGWKEREEEEHTLVRVVGQVGQVGQVGLACFSVVW